VLCEYLSRESPAQQRPNEKEARTAKHETARTTELRADAVAKQYRTYAAQVRQNAAIA
jgi:hypothetical protein